MTTHASDSSLVFDHSARYKDVYICMYIDVEKGVGFMRHRYIEVSAILSMERCPYVSIHAFISVEVEHVRALQSVARLATAILAAVDQLVKCAKSMKSYTPHCDQPLMCYLTHPARSCCCTEVKLMSPICVSSHSVNPMSVNELKQAR